MSSRPPWISPATGDYDTDRLRHLRQLYQLVPGEIEKVTWPIERLQALRDERLRRLLHTAKERSPWHARRLRHVDVDTISGDDLRAIPPMTKADLMLHWDEIVTEPRLTLDMASRHLAEVTERGPAYLLDQYHVVATGGSTGVFVWDWDGWLQAALHSWRHVLWLLSHCSRPVTPPARIASVHAAHAIHMSEAMRRTFEPPGLGRLFPVTVSLADTVAALNDYRPTSLSGYPSVLHQLALEGRAGRLDIAPVTVTGGAEPFSEAAKILCREVFDATVIDPYGTSESWVIAISHPGTPGLHLIEDAAVYEPVDRDGRPTAPGETAARLYLTNVINHVLPLVRYEVTDEVRFLDEPNPDPWPGRRIAAIEGRTDDLFLYPGGVPVHPYVFWSALGRDPAVVEYQVRQTPAGADVLVRLGGQFAVEKARSKIVASLVELGLPQPAVTVTEVGSIVRLQGSSKLKRFVPLPG